MTKKQRDAVEWVLRGFRVENPAEFHFGDAVGADAEAFEIAKKLGYKTVAYPCTEKDQRAFCAADVVYDPLPPVVRNRKIVQAVGYVIAAPKERREVPRGSGTWMIIRCAKELRVSYQTVFP